MIETIKNNKMIGMVGLLIAALVLVFVPAQPAEATHAWYQIGSRNDYTWQQTGWAMSVNHTGATDQIQFDLLDCRRFDERVKVVAKFWYEPWWGGAGYWREATSFYVDECWHGPQTVGLENGRWYRILLGETGGDYGDGVSQQVDIRVYGKMSW